MNNMLLVLAAVLCISPAAAAQRKKRRRPPSHSAPAEKKLGPPPIIGQEVSIVTRSGEHFLGQIVELTAYSIHIKSASIDSVIPFERVQSIAVGGSTTAVPDQVPPAASQSFAADARPTIAAFKGLDLLTKSSPEYADYGDQLRSFRETAERFVSRYGPSNSAVEARAAGLVAAALNDYSWARTVWTLKLGRSGNVTVRASDSPEISDALILYPDVLRQGADSKIAADKLISRLWNEASAKLIEFGKLAETGPTPPH